ncbi:hypothetical protein ACIQFZ_21470 [Streptomyces sp. NPDC093064]|uniref:hypothetical protein n=1 Tax=unclassified Streptomyces TaxID=2593676 RepID=UPI00341FADA2
MKRAVRQVVREGVHDPGKVLLDVALTAYPEAAAEAMAIRPTTHKDLDVFVDIVHASFGRFPDAPAR